MATKIHTSLISFIFVTTISIDISAKTDGVLVEYIPDYIGIQAMEDHFFKQWEDNPALLYAHLVQRKEAASTKNIPLPLPEMLVSIMRIKNSIDSRLSSDKELTYVTQEEIFQLRNFSSQFTYILQRGVPYSETIELMFDYISFMDCVFRRLCPSLPNSIAKLLTEKKFANLALDKNLFIFFSFKPVGIDFFIKTRPAPIYIMGLLDYPSFESAHQAKIRIDGFYTEIGGFTHHDAEHARADWKVDSNRIITNELVEERQRVRDDIMLRVNQLALNNPDMATTVKILLFEILHERGLQYDISLLMSYLKLPLFSKTSKDKWKSLFWDPLPGKPELFNLFDNAELWLREQVKELLINHNKKLLGNEDYRISTIETVTMKDGFVQKIEILKEDDVNIYLSDHLTLSQEEKTIPCSLYNIKTFGLVDVNPSENDFVFLSGKGNFLQTKYNQLLKLWKSQTEVSYKIIRPGYPILDRLIKINENDNKIFFCDCSNDMYSINLDSIIIESN